MDSHREKALAAVAKGNSVLQDAANTLRTLKGEKKLSFVSELQSFYKFYFHINFSPVIAKTKLFFQKGIL
jgi:hypothetical protein